MQRYVYPFYVLRSLSFCQHRERFISSASFQKRLASPFRWRWWKKNFPVVEDVTVARSRAESEITKNLMFLTWRSNRYHASSLDILYCPSTIYRINKNKPTAKRQGKGGGTIIVILKSKFIKRYVKASSRVPAYSQALYLMGGCPERPEGGARAAAIKGFVIKKKSWKAEDRMN